MPANTPAEASHQLIAAINAGDLDAIVALYESGATLVAEPGHPVTGTAAIREAMTGFISMKPTLTVEVPLVLESGDTALLHSQWTLAETDPNGDALNMGAQEVEVVSRQPDGTWRFIVDNPWGAP